MLRLRSFWSTCIGKLQVDVRALGSCLLSIPSSAITWLKNFGKLLISCGQVSVSSCKKLLQRYFLALQLNFSLFVFYYQIKQTHEANLFDDSIML
jgi:hypothetical protein